MRTWIIGFGVAAAGFCSSAASAQIVIGGGDCQPDFTALCPDVYAPVLCEDGNVYSNGCVASVWGCQDNCVPTDGGYAEALTADSGAPLGRRAMASGAVPGDELLDPAGPAPLIQIGGDCPDFTASCPAVYDPVICSDGNTYSNLCEATVWGCATDCVPTGGGVVALGMSGVVSMGNGANPGDEVGNPDAPAAIRFGGGGGCPDFTALCPAVYDPVICEDGNTYGNLCEATVWGCQSDCTPTGGGVIAVPW